MEIILIYIEFINQYVNNYFYYSLVIFFIFLTIYCSLSIPGGVLLFIASGFLFEFYLGFLINLFSITIGSLFFFLFSKFILRILFPNLYRHYSEKVTNIIKDSSIEYLIVLRMIPGPPLLIQNLCLSILNISKTKFFYTSFDIL